MQPIPPLCAMAIAKRLSVTVSIAAEIIGISIEIFLVIFVLVFVSLGRTSEYRGLSKTSSNVKAGDDVSIILRLFVMILLPII